jgi:hypothetical protein
MSDYNGHTNRETWLVKLHYNPRAVDDLDWIKESLEDAKEAIANDCLRDMLNLNLIDWDELRGLLEEEKAA